MLRAAVFLALACALSAAAAAAGPVPEPVIRHEPRGGSVPDVGVDSLAWLAGRWRGEALGGTAEEAWLPPAGGQMAGVFRLVKDGAPAFYEAVILLEIEGRLTMRLKHFDAALVGWEEKGETVDFPLVDHEPGVWYFDGLTIVKEAEDRATYHVLLSDGENGRVATFPYLRTGPR